VAPDEEPGDVRVYAMSVKKKEKLQHGEKKKIP